MSPSTRKSNRKSHGNSNSNTNQNSNSNNKDNATTITMKNNKSKNKNKNSILVVKGMDDCGTFYNSHAELQEAQLKRRDEFYNANAQYWNNGGYGGSTDDEAMIGDTDGLSDCEDGLAFLDQVLERLEDKQTKTNISHNNKTTTPRRAVAMDLGAGVGRITKHVLLKRYEAVHLVEGNTFYSNQSRLYLGRKRAARCTFTNENLQDLNAQVLQQKEFGTTDNTNNHNGGGGGEVDLMWIQWTLQYLTDADVITCLKTLSSLLRPGVGVLIVKENRPFGTARQDRFQMDTPAGGNQRYDITRPDAHHRLLFGSAGFTVETVQQGVETNTYALMKS